MPRKRRSDLPDGHFHVWAHAVAGGVLFHDDRDRRYFLGLLESAAARHALRVLSFVLLDNHFHLLVHGRSQALSRAMWSVNSRFAHRHNARHARRGHVFDGRFQCKAIHDERYLLTVLRYIALNPVEAGLCRRPEEHRWSAHRALAGAAAAPGFLAAGEAVAFFAQDPAVAPTEYAAFVAGTEPCLHDLVRLNTWGIPVDRPPLESVLHRHDDEALRVAADRWGYTLAEIAAALGRSKSSVQRAIVRARCG